MLLTHLEDRLAATKTKRFTTTINHTNTWQYAVAAHDPTVSTNANRAIPIFRPTRVGGGKPHFMAQENDSALIGMARLCPQSTLRLSIRSEQTIYGTYSGRQPNARFPAFQVTRSCRYSNGGDFALCHCISRISWKGEDERKNVRTTCG